MKSEEKSDHHRADGVGAVQGQVLRPRDGAGRGNFTQRDCFALVFGLFLGLAILKFGNPVILDDKIIPPSSIGEAWQEAWPTHWGNWPLALLSLAGIWLARTEKLRWPAEGMFWVLPLAWFAWQIVSATQTVDPTLTRTVLRHFAGCLACYFLGVVVLGQERLFRWLVIGVIAGFTVCMVRAVNQRIEFPRDRQLLIEAQQTGWTNFPPEVFQEMKRSGTIVATNGIDIINPIFLARLTKGRVYGTLVYPNALAGAVLLLLPLSILLAVKTTRRFRPWTRWAIIALTLFLGGASLFWTSSKSGWLIAMMLAGIGLFRLDWPKLWKGSVFVGIVAIGLTVFALRFHNYFATGASSLGARFDYWRAAVRIASEHPLFGSGPGTFQRPYASLKAPDAEMARLAHNDYLEQFCDSGVIGGLSYAAWIGLLLVTVGRRVWRLSDPLRFAVFIGLLGWFVQGFSEFSLYVPALAWTGFALLGWLLGVSGKQIDSNRPGGYCPSRE